MLAALWFAVLKAGGVVVCTMPLNRARELVFIADKAHVSLAITDTRLAGECAQAMGQHADGRTRQGARVLEYNAPDGGSNGPSLEQLMSGKPTTFANVDTAANDVALIAFTSGRFTADLPRVTMPESGSFSIVDIPHLYLFKGELE